jgi:hypothetical protein
MSRNLYLVFAVVAMANAASLPTWLESYPGATPTVHASEALVESRYTIAAQAEDVVEHYRKLFGGAGLAFHPNSDGVGTSIRAEAPECDLLIQIRSRDEGTLVNVNCSAKTLGSSSSAPPTDIRMISGGASSSRAMAAPAPVHLSGDEMMQRHHQIAMEMGLHRVHPDAPAPPLVWPSWLTHVSGGALRPTSGMNPAKDAMLRAQYTTNVPMTELAKFYREAMDSHEYPARGGTRTGVTSTGIQQNAQGNLEGFNYPDGAPGAYSTIDISYGRSVLNGPITVTIRFTTHEYIAKRGY